MLARLRVVEGDQALRGAGALRRRRRADRARRPWLRAARARLSCAADPAPAAMTPSTITARLRDSEPIAQGQGAVHQRRCPAGVFDQHRADFGVDQGSAGRVVSAVGREPARWSRPDRPPASGRRAVSVLRHPVDFVRHPGPDRVGLFRLLRDPGPPPGEAGGGCAGSTDEPSRRSSPTATAAAGSSIFLHWPQLSQGPPAPDRPCVAKATSLPAETDVAGVTTHRDQHGGRLHRPRQHHRAAQIGHRGLAPVAEGGPDLQLVADTAWARPAGRRALRRRPPRPRPRWGWDAARRRAARPAPPPTAIPRPPARTSPPAPPSPARRRS